MTPALMLPADLIGTVPEVRDRMLPRVEAFLTGEPWTAGAPPLVDAREVPGLVALAPPPPPLDEQPHVLPYLPLALLTQAVVAAQVERTREDDAVATCLETPCGLLGLLSPQNEVLVYPPERHRPILSAALRFWDTLDSAGARYSTGEPTGAYLWDLTTNLTHVLGRLGVPERVLREPLPPEGLWAIVPQRLMW